MHREMLGQLPKMIINRKSNEDGKHKRCSLWMDSYPKAKYFQLFEVNTYKWHLTYTNLCVPLRCPILKVPFDFEYFAMWTYVITRLLLSISWSNIWPEHIHLDSFHSPNESFETLLRFDAWQPFVTICVLFYVCLIWFDFNAMTERWNHSTTAELCVKFTQQTNGLIWFIENSQNGKWMKLKTIKRNVVTFFHNSYTQFWLLSSFRDCNFMRLTLAQNHKIS